MAKSRLEEDDDFDDMSITILDKPCFYWPKLPLAATLQLIAHTEFSDFECSAFSM